ncbi:MAG: hypothetical protein IPM69_02695 [Ignavibacteria bacterium]|nr:hypothetical protein [Ignavibacteria bacterium]
MLTIKNISSVGLLAFVTMVFFVQNTFAQSSTFRVMTAKNTTFTNDGANWKSLRTGVQLNDNDKIKVDAGGMAILVHSSGKTIEVKSPGSFNVNELSGQAQSGKGVAGKFAGYVMDELTKGADKKDSRYQQNMQFTGATSKMSNSVNKLCLDSPNSTNIIGSTVTLAWRICDDAPKFDAPHSNADKTNADRFSERSGSDAHNPSVVLTLTDSLGTKIREENLDVNALSLDVSSLEKGKLYMWSVHLKNKPNVKLTNNTFFILNDEQAKQVEAEAATISEELGTTSAWSEIVTASLYEQNKLYGMALSKYRAGIERDPSVHEYQQLYAKCLERVGIMK